MRKVRYMHGSLELESIEAAGGRAGRTCRDLKVDARNRAKELIEDFMIAANGVSARFLEKRGLPTLQRVVRSPERWDRIEKVAADSWRKLPTDTRFEGVGGVPLPAAGRPIRLRFPDLSLTIVQLRRAGEYIVQSPAAPPRGTSAWRGRIQPFNGAKPPPTGPEYHPADAEVRDGGRQAALHLRRTLLGCHALHRAETRRQGGRQVRSPRAAQFLGDRIGQTFDAIARGFDKGPGSRLLAPPWKGSWKFRTAVEWDSRSRSA